MSAFSTLDHRHMERALELAARGLTTTDPNPRVGCVIARGESIVGEGWHERAGEPHAEVLALRAAGAASRGATVYVTLEPCTHHGRTPPCVEPLIEAGVTRVVCAMIDPNPLVRAGGIARLEAAGIRAEVGLLEAQAQELNCGFVRRMTVGLPWVRVKLGVSLDGRTALASGESRWITGEVARHDVQHWRARSSAILTGSGTVLQDDPQLNVRDETLGPAPRQPWRVVVDTELRIAAQARVLADPGRADAGRTHSGRTIVFTAALASPRRQELEAQGARIETVGRSAQGVDLHQVLARLAELEVNEVLVEAGSRLVGSLLDKRLVNELLIYMAPHVLGSGARGMFELSGPASLQERLQLKFTDVRRLGDDLRIMARPDSEPR
jgi:diaminohydroxyphosphoribosylaminopyrimidine deaminase/5-amino-6-(5-phosphoribosylamino)uracil reductase